MILNSIVCNALVTLLIVSRFCIEGFSSPHARALPPQTVLKAQQPNHNEFDSNMTRRSILDKGSKLLSAPLLLNLLSIGGAEAMIGSLPEFSDSNAVLQGISIDVADLSQQNDMIEFLQNGFNFKILRQRKVQSVSETVGNKIIFNLLRKKINDTNCPPVIRQKFKLFVNIIAIISGWDLGQKK